MKHAYLIICSLLLVCCLQPVSGKQVKLSVVTWDQHPAIVDRIKAFETANPDIKIDFLPTDYTSAVNKVLVMTAGGTAPDVYWTPDGQVASWARSDFNLPLNDLIPSKSLSYHAPGILQSYTHFGKLQGIPWTANVALLLYNRTHFADAGIAEPIDAHIDVIRQAAKKLTWRDANVVKRMGFEQDAGFHVLNWAPSMFGGDYTDAEARTSTINTPETLRSLQILVEMQLNDQSVIRGSQSGKNLFIEQKSAMFAAHVGAVSKMLQAGVDLGIGRVPKGSHRAQVFASAAWSIARNTPYPAEAVRFVTWMTSPESEAHTTMGGRTIPTIPSLFSRRLFATWPEGCMETVAAAVMESYMPRLFRSPWNDKWGALFSQHWNKVVAGQEALGVAAEEIDRLGTPILRGEQK